jgi:D-alanyl-D-alanine carboxypeptidase
VRALSLLFLIVAGLDVRADAAPIKPQEAMTACLARAGAGFNGAVYVRRRGVVTERAFGAADALGTIPVTERTRFNMGSASKMLTAVAIGRLVDQGRVAFDAPVGRYLPDLPPETAKITLAQLLNHTSGLGDYFSPVNATAIAKARTATDLLPLALVEPPAFAPGTRRAYSNAGFVVLGAVVEKVSGLTYGAYLQREIFAPLGMKRTGPYGGVGAAAMTRMGPSGDGSGAARPAPALVEVMSPAGGVYSTPSDLARFLTALSDGRLLRPETSATLLTPRAAPGGSPSVYGYGFGVAETPFRRVGHNGGAPGVNAEVWLYPASGDEIIVLANQDPPAATRLFRALEPAVIAADPASACPAVL